MEPQGRTIRDGLVVGLIASAAVAVFYAVFDVLAARGALYTVNLLGRALFTGLRDPAVLMLPLRLDVAAIVWYSALHLAVSLLIGLIVTGLVALADQRPAWAPLIRFTIMAGFVVTVVALGLWTHPLRPVLPWWSIVVANGLAVILAGAYLLRARPGTWQRLSPFAA